MVIECNNIDEVRMEIDRIDKEMINLLGERSKYVKQASKYKKTEESVKAPERLKRMMIQRKKLGFEQGLNMIFIEKFFKGITSYFIEKEKNQWLIENEFDIKKVEIFGVEKEDLKEILELQISSYQSEAINCDDFEIPPLKSNIEEMENEMKEKQIFKAVFKDKIIGSIRGYEKDNICYIEKIIVHDDYQNIGIGKKLISYIESYYKNCKNYKLFTGSKSEKNLKLYQKLGYEIYEEKKINDNYGLVFLKK